MLENWNGGMMEDWNHAFENPIFHIPIFQSSPIFHHSILFAVRI
jgi:hypothetical protein